MLTARLAIQLKAFRNELAARTNAHTSRTVCSDPKLSKHHKVQEQSPKEGPKLEQGIAQYEEAPRQRLAEPTQKKQQAKQLPFKTPEGQLVYAANTTAKPALPRVMAHQSVCIFLQSFLADAIIFASAFLASSVDLNYIHFSCQGVQDADSPTKREQKLVFVHRSLPKASLS